MTKMGLKDEERKTNCQRQKAHRDSMSMKVKLTNKLTKMKLEGNSNQILQHKAMGLHFKLKQGTRVHLCSFKDLQHEHYRG